jgi:hypothetical protein
MQGAWPLWFALVLLAALIGWALGGWWAARKRALPPPTREATRYRRPDAVP